MNTKIFIFAVVLGVSLSAAQTIKLNTPESFERAANDWQLQRLALEDDVQTTIRSAIACPGGHARPDDPAHCWTAAHIAAYKATAISREKQLIKRMQLKYGIQFTTPQQLRVKAVRK